MGDRKIDLKFGSKVHFGVRSNTGVLKATAISFLSGGPIRLMYIVVFTFRSIWALIWGCMATLFKYADIKID